MLVEAVGNLTSESFLDLQSAAEEVDDARQFAESDDAFSGDIRYMTLAIKGEQVVLTKAEEVYVPQDDHLVVVLLEDGVADYVVWILRVATGEEAKGLLDALRRFAEADAGGVLAQTEEELTDKVWNGRLVRFFH